MSKPLYQKIPLNELENIIRKNLSFFEVLKDIGYKQIYQKSTIENIKKYCDEHNIDYSNLNETRELEVLICTECNQKKSIKEFYQYNNKVHHVCNSCKSKKQKDYNKNNVNNLNDYKKQHKCEKCGETRFYLLDFHHKNPDQKEFSISKKATIKLENLMPEIKKCIILCSNCHREFHYLNEHFGLKLDDYLK